MINDKNTADGNTSPEPAGQIVGEFFPGINQTPPRDIVRDVKLITPESAGFREAFMGTLRNREEGSLTRYLFLESPPAPAGDKQDGETDQDIYAMLTRHFGKILCGGYAWDEMIEHTRSYDFVDGDLRALDYAVENGLISYLPSNIHLIECGTGGKSGVEKPIKTIEAILQSGNHMITGYTGIDILSRYAIESAKAIRDKFNIHATGIAFDFMTMSADKIPIPVMKDSAPLYLFYGGTLANAPDYSLSGGKNGMQNAAMYLTKISRQHSVGPHLLIAYDAETSPGILSAKYQRTVEFEAFVLGEFPIAIHGNDITDRSYDPFQYWKMGMRYDPEAKAVKLCAVCTKDHDVPTFEGNVPVRKGYSKTNILSYKWNETIWKTILDQAGFEPTKIFRKKNSPYGFILAGPKSGQQSLDFRP